VQLFTANAVRTSLPDATAPAGINPLSVLFLTRWSGKFRRDWRI